jgi:exonuclease I
MAEIRRTVESFDSNDFKDNKEALELRQIFNILEEYKSKNKVEKNKKDGFFNKYDMKENLNIKILQNLEIRPKNRYKLKLQRILIHKNLSN